MEPLGYVRQLVVERPGYALGREHLAARQPSPNLIGSMVEHLCGAGAIRSGALLGPQDVNRHLLMRSTPLIR